MGTRRRGRPPKSKLIDLTAGLVDSLPKEAQALLPKGLKRPGKLSARKSPLGYTIAQYPGGRRAVFQLLALSDDEEAEKIVAVWNGLTSSEQHDLTLEILIERAEMRARDFIGLISRVAWDFNIDVGNALAGFAYPKIMKASIDRAMKPHGTEDRRIHLEKAGFAASKKPFISVSQTNQTLVEREPEPGEAPRMAHTARRIVRDLPPAD